jgi:hypothetical protein
MSLKTATELLAVQDVTVLLEESVFMLTVN